MKLVVGLGNPGPEYARHRHNVGFQCLDLLADAYGLRFDRVKDKARRALGVIEGQRVVLLKPITFMNAVGPAVAAAARFYKVDLAEPELQLSGPGLMTAPEAPGVGAAPRESELAQHTLASAHLKAE